MFEFPFFSSLSFLKTYISFLTFPSRCIITKNQLKKPRQPLSNLRFKFWQKSILRSDQNPRLLIKKLWINLRNTLLLQILGNQIPQVELFSHFSGEGHCELLEEIRVTIISKLTGHERKMESVWHGGKIVLSFFIRDEYFLQRQALIKIKDIYRKETYFIALVSGAVD